MGREIKAIETYYKGYHFRSRVEARWAIFFDALGIDYEYEVEGFDMEGTRYLPDFYIPSIDRWFEIKGKKMTLEEIKKCEQFCNRTDNEGIKFSIVIGAPKLAKFNNILGIKEFAWEWPSEHYPDNTLFLAEELVNKEYYSRFLPMIWKVPGVCDEQLVEAVRLAREARFEFGETPRI